VGPLVSATATASAAASGGGGGREGHSGHGVAAATGTVVCDGIQRTVVFDSF
jgi:hypothetical protein